MTGNKSWQVAEWQTEAMIGDKSWQIAEWQKQMIVEWETENREAWLSV